jgi:hypothetical protein
MCYFRFSFLVVAVFLTFSISAQISDTLKNSDTIPALSSHEQQRLLYQAELNKLAEKNVKKDKPNGNGLPTRFFISFGLGAKSFAGPYDIIEKNFYKKTWSPFVQQHLGFRYKINPVKRRPLGNAIGIWYRYSRLSGVFANSFMKEQFPYAPAFYGKMNSLDAGVFLMAGEKMGLTFSKGWNILEYTGHPDFINKYWALGVQAVARIWRIEGELSLTSMFNKNTLNPCLSVDLSLRYKLGFARF